MFAVRDQGEEVLEILPSGKLGRGRTFLLALIEIALFVLACESIVVAWARFDGPPGSFGLLVASSLFLGCVLAGLYRRPVYIHHVNRLLVSGLAHALVALALVAFCKVAIEDPRAVNFVIGMACLSYVVTNTLRPVLVEVIRAGNENEQRRQPVKTVY